MRIDEAARTALNLAAERPSAEFQVEWLPDGSVRLPGHALAQSLPDELRRSPTLARGIGLYVQRTTDLHLERLDGPIVGKALAGAFLPVVAPGPRATEVVLVDYWVHAFIESDALGIEPVQEAEPPIESGDYYDWDLSIRAAPGAPPFGSTSCGPLHVLTREAKTAKVSQYRNGIWLTGWVDSLPDERRGAHRCLPRTVELPGPYAPPPKEPGKLPHGYVAISDDASLQDPLGALILRGGSLYWPFVAVDHDAVTCLEWHVKAATANKIGRDEFDRVASLRRSRGKDDKLSTEYQLGYIARRRAFLPDLYLVPHADEYADEDCGGSYTIVAAGPDHVRVIEGRYPRGIVAYHPEDTEDWYLSRDACEAAAVRMNGPGPGLNRVRVGC